MNVTSIIFSPTGGVEKVAKVIESEFDSITRIDLTKTDTDYRKIQFNSNDYCIISVPSFGGRVPKIAVERIRKINGNGAKTIIIAVYGNREYEDTLIELKTELTNCGFVVKAAIAAIAQHSIMPQFATARPDESDIQILKEFSKQAKSAIKSDTYTELKVPGNNTYRQYGGLPLKPKANSRCNKCGLCATSCPTEAIPKENPNSIYSDKCITCMRCVKICPNHARSINKILVALAASKMKKACSVRKNNELFI